MSDFEKWFRSLNANGKTVYFLGNEHKVSEMAWNHQQAIIDDLIYKAKLRESDHRALLVKYQATKKCWEDVGGKCEELKAQFNNMEACYIEKKKELEDQHKKVDEVLEYLDGESANRWGLWKEKADMLDQGASNAFEEAYWMVKKALRG